LSPEVANNKAVTHCPREQLIFVKMRTRPGHFLLRRDIGVLSYCLFVLKSAPRTGGQTTSGTWGCFTGRGAGICYAGGSAESIPALPPATIGRSAGQTGAKPPLPIHLAGDRLQRTSVCVRYKTCAGARQVWLCGVYAREQLRYSWRRASFMPRPWQPGEKKAVRMSEPTPNPTGPPSSLAASSMNRAQPWRTSLSP